MFLPCGTGSPIQWSWHGRSDELGSAVQLWLLSAAGDRWEVGGREGGRMIEETSSEDEKSPKFTLGERTGSRSEKSQDSSEKRCHWRHQAGDYSKVVLEQKLLALADLSADCPVNPCLCATQFATLPIMLGKRRPGRATQRKSSCEDRLQCPLQPRRRLR